MSAQSHRTAGPHSPPSSPRSRSPPSRPRPARSPPIEHGVPAIPVNARGTDVAAQDQQVPRPVVNARGTDVAAQDQQMRQPIVNAPGTDVAAQDPQMRQPIINAPGTDVAAADQQAPIVDNPGPVSPADRQDDSLPTLLLLALIALGVTLVGLGLASRLAATRRRTRAAA